MSMPLETGRLAVGCMQVPSLAPIHGKTALCRGWNKGVCLPRSLKAAVVRALVHVSCAFIVWSVLEHRFIQGLKQEGFFQFIVMCSKNCQKYSKYGFFQTVMWFCLDRLCVLLYIITLFTKTRVSAWNYFGLCRSHVCDSLSISLIAKKGLYKLTPEAERSASDVSDISFVSTRRCACDCGFRSEAIIEAC